MGTITADVAGFRDYYEILQLNPNAEEETISRVFRILVKRYHPDNRDRGNTKKFNEVMDAYRILSDPEKRAAYDVKYDQNRATVLKLFDEASASDSFDSDRRVCEGILSLLYVSRRRDPDRGGVGVIQMERLLGCPSQHTVHLNDADSPPARVTPDGKSVVSVRGAEVGESRVL